MLMNTSATHCLDFLVHVLMRMPVKLHPMQGFRYVDENQQNVIVLTDPGIHCRDMSYFTGNLGDIGFESFLVSHYKTFDDPMHGPTTLHGNICYAFLPEHQHRR